MIEGTCSHLFNFEKSSFAFLLQGQGSTADASCRGSEGASAAQREFYGNGRILGALNVTGDSCTSAFCVLSEFIMFCSIADDFFLYIHKTTGV